MDRSSIMAIRRLQQSLDDAFILAYIQLSRPGRKALQ